MGVFAGALSRVSSYFVLAVPVAAWAAIALIRRRDEHPVSDGAAFALGTATGAIGSLTFAVLLYGLFG
jgi:hypothetical protein